MRAGLSWLSKPLPACLQHAGMCAGIPLLLQVCLKCWQAESAGWLKTPASPTPTLLFLRCKPVLQAQQGLQVHYCVMQDVNCAGSRNPPHTIRRQKGCWHATHGHRASKDKPYQGFMGLMM